MEKFVISKRNWKKFLVRYNEDFVTMNSNVMCKGSARERILVYEALLMDLGLWDEFVAYRKSKM